MAFFLTVINNNLIQEEINRRLKSGNACHHSVQNPLPSCLLPVALYGHETWSLILRVDHRMREFENRVVRRISGPKRDEVIAEWRKQHNKTLHDLYAS
jgi:hypothetical protein